MIRNFYGDIFESDAHIIAHQVNCQGVMGSGIALQVKNKFPKVYNEYKSHCELYRADQRNNLLGTCLLVNTGENRIIANLFAQLTFGRIGLYTDYKAFDKCLKELRWELERFSSNSKWKLAFPYRIGSHRGGANWERISFMIGENFSESKQIDVEIWRFDKNG